MRPGEMYASVATLRRALQRRVGETSIAADAADAGVPHSVLRKFLLGSAARGATLAKLRAWYAVAEVEAGMTADRARAAVASLVQAMPPEYREGAARDVVAPLVERYGGVDAKVPDWLEEIRTG